MSRLDYAPKLKEIQITDIKKGLGIFAPKPDKHVSFAALKDALKRAGYALGAAEIIVEGRLLREGEAWVVVAEQSGQRFALEGANVSALAAGVSPDAHVEVVGDWKTAGAGAASREVITPRELKKAAGATGTTTRGEATRDREANDDEAEATIDGEASGEATRDDRATSVRFVKASYDAPASSPFSGSLIKAVAPRASAPPAPIRVTSPGLTVYKGGAFTPRLYFIRQRLGDLEVRRQVLNLSVTYTPTAKLQLEAEMPFARTSYDDGATSGSGIGAGNLTLWGKYRFFRTVKTYGDRQAALRVGLELPTGTKSAPGETKIDAPAFVRQQLSPINGGFAPHFDVSFSQAGGRFIFGGNVEAVLRTERDGFRTGHELRVNTDVEYVLLPRAYETPGGELFAILETSFVRRGAGRVGGSVVADGRSNEFYLAPGLQYAAAPRFVLEGSFQFPVARDAGAQSLRTELNVLVGVRYLF